jgi:A/G-specific adenine glycosylase
MISMSHETELHDFDKTVRDHYAAHGRHDLPWRVPEPDGSFDGYKILVSELMLQQTQVTRVIPKYAEFITRFPSIERLATSPLGDVLQIWSGLGYNRRAKFLQQAALKLRDEFGGIVPPSANQLEELPGVGPNTAGAILAYTYNLPIVFIETNIRTVFIHHFFQEQLAVTDSAIHELVAQTIDYQDPRSWYWAVMDYGTYIKQNVGNMSVASRSYVKQSAFEGSSRQIRGRVIRLLASGPQSLEQLQANIDDDRLAEILSQLCYEGLILGQENQYRI